MNKLEKALYIGGWVSMVACPVIALTTNLDMSYSFWAVTMGLISTDYAASHYTERLQASSLVTIPISSSH